MLRYLIITYLILAGLCIFSSCSNRQYQVLFDQKKAMTDNQLKKNTSPDTSSQGGQLSLSDYRIKPQDILQVRNLQNLKYIVDDAPISASTSSIGNSAQGQTYQVEQDGTVALPVIGHVAVVGLTRAETAKKIEDLYRSTLLKNPIIEVTITNLKVTILGEVKAQGVYPLLKDRTTLVDIIGASGGLTEQANQNNIKIIHGTDKNSKVTEIDLEDLQSVYSASSVVKNGDIIYVSQNKRAVRNTNLQNFSFIIQPALLLINALLIVFTFTHR